MIRFVIAENLDHALEVLAQGDVEVIAGGTDLMIHLRELRLSGGKAPDTILDLSRLDELKRLEPNAGQPYVGAGVTFRELETNSKVGQHLPLLAQAAATVGSVQVRQTATIGGNVANASPAADGMTALTALGAQAEIASKEGTRWCPLEELITAPNKTTLRSQELIVGFQLDKLPADGQMFAKVGRRQAVSVARLNLAICLDHTMDDPRAVLGACFPSPRRLKDVEKVIQQGEPGDELWWAAGHQAAQHFTDVCGWRSSATYKVPAVTRVFARTLGQVWTSLAGAS